MALMICRAVSTPALPNEEAGRVAEAESQGGHDHCPDWSSLPQEGMKQQSAEEYFLEKSHEDNMSDDCGPDENRQVIAYPADQRNGDEYQQGQIEPHAQTRDPRGRP